MGNDNAKELKRQKSESDLFRDVALSEQRKTFDAWMEDKEKQHKSRMEEQKRYREEFIEYSNKMFEKMERLQRDTIAHHRREIEMLSAGLQSFAIGRLDTEKTSRKLKKTRIVVADNLVYSDRLKDQVSGDEDILKTWFEANQLDVSPIQGGRSIESAVKVWKEDTYSSNDGILIFIFSHGSDMILREGRRTFELETVLEPFFKNETLRGKPKIFFVLAIQADDGSGGIEEKNLTGSLSHEEEYILCYCEMTKNKYLQTASNEGSLFIKSLVETFKIYRGNDIFTTLEKTKDFILARNEGADITFVLENYLNGEVKLAQP